MWLVNLGDTIVFHEQTHSFATGNITNADALPEFTVFEGTSTVAIISSTMRLMDSTGFYQGSFLVGSSTFVSAGYCTIRVAATVSSVSAADVIPFFIAPTTTVRLGVDLVGTGSDPLLPPASTGTLASKIDWICMRLLAKETFNRTTGVCTIYNSASATAAAFTAADDGTTFTRPKASS